MTMTNYARSIVLPCDEVFRNLKNAKRFAIDIGKVVGTLRLLKQLGFVGSPLRRGTGWPLRYDRYDLGMGKKKGYDQGMAKKMG